MFSEQFAFKSHTLVNFVGGGGKTALILKLLEEYCVQGPVLYTTTTRIHPPESKEGVGIISSDNIPFLKELLDRIGKNCFEQRYKLAITRSYMSPNLLQGVPADFYSSMDRNLFSMLLNEADGAAGYSLKLPREGEPVYMEYGNYLVPVIGIDCLNKTLGPDTLFRWKDCSEYFSLNAGDRITPKMAAGILMHKQGVCKGWKPGMTLIPFINKVDSPEQDDAARELSRFILENGNFPVERVAYGSALFGRAGSLVTS